MAEAYSNDELHFTIRNLEEKLETETREKFRREYKAAIAGLKKAENYKAKP